MSTQDRLEHLTFKQVDVFTSSKFRGNPVAVFFNADALTSERMQQIANWTNLSETTFVQTPTEGSGADYKLRIFTPNEELPFAGHPTIGTAHAVIESGVVTPKNGKLVQECKAGLVTLTHDERTGKIEFKLPYYHHSKLEQELQDEIIDALGVKGRVEHVVCSRVGPTWITIKLKDANDVLDLKPDFDRLKSLFPTTGLDKYSIFGKYNRNEYPNESSPNVYEARNFFLLDSFTEDPVCGSGAGSDSSLLAEFEGYEGGLVIKQGRKLGRDGSITAKIVKERSGDNKYAIYIGGNAVTVISGEY